ncbi:aminoglycoside phosphotransferase family protein [Streptomyces sp. W16]|uniref:aminoglycoside phosphotransferase family protein n=1 Tax=Streptomyces sp. W16 TaxID=3076631 RepID=UPI00295AA0ED|nr:aminoglycoside phosphotransferase family protein [Streptomyces sp. W16]MDV9174031.1 aminoglycoside phosphotransferase family protein [Streptomyces sp. W16]
MTIDSALVGRLLAAQFPQWAELPLTLVEQAGSDHVIHRLGETMSVRLPRSDWADGEAAKQHTWLRRLAPLLPLPVPEPLGLGTPDCGYAWHWSVTRWLDGTTATVEGLADPDLTARQLGEFLRTLHEIPPAGALVPGVHPELVRAPLADRDEATRAAIGAVAGVFDAAALTEVWDNALRAPAWEREPVWCHGDFHTGNLLTVDGHLSAVIDFGGVGMGDPACDLVVAYTLLSATSRSVFREAVGLDDATWTRGLGWALATGLNAHTSYAATEPHVARQTTRQLTEVLAEHAVRVGQAGP